MIAYFIICIVLIGLDQFVKYLTVTNLQLGETKEFIPGILSFTSIRNTGAAWSILEGQMWFFYIVTTIVVLVIIYLLITNVNGNKWFMIGLSFVLAGALGNFIDRLRLGYVVDMFQTEFINFPIFNVADSVLVVGVICLFIYLFKEEKAVEGDINGKN